MRKVEVDNPRYPHTIKIVRKLVPDWLDDDDDLSGSSSSSSSSSEGDDDEIVIYEGPGRSFTDTTTTGDAKVDTNKRKCSIPVRFDQWPAADENGNLRIPMSGDLVQVVKANITEEWEVKDFDPDNDRSIVYGEHNRNLNVE